MRWLNQLGFSVCLKWHWEARRSQQLLDTFVIYPGHHSSLLRHFPRARVDSVFCDGRLQLPRPSGMAAITVHRVHNSIILVCCSTKLISHNRGQVDLRIALDASVAGCRAPRWSLPSEFFPKFSAIRSIPQQVLHWLSGSCVWTLPCHCKQPIGYANDVISVAFKTAGATGGYWNSRCCRDDGY